MPRKPTKLSILYENRFLPNRELAKLLYGEANEETLARVYALKYKLKKKMMAQGQRGNAFISLNFPAQAQISFNDLKHYEPISAFNHDSMNDLILLILVLRLRLR